MRLLLNWLMSAVALLIVTWLVPGFELRGFLPALLAALVICVVNATVGTFLKIVTFPLTIITLGIFWFVINALMLELASWLVPGFRIVGFGAAFLGAIALVFINFVIRFVVPQPR
jgi:putative membrane protein